MTVPRQLNLFKSRRQRGAALPPALEFHLHAAVADILRRWINPGWRFNHIANGEHRLPATAARLKRMGVQKGWPDFVLLPPAGMHGAYFLELKRKGGRLSPEQQDFADWACEHGYRYATTDNLKETIAVLGGWGAIRTEIHVQ